MKKVFRGLLHTGLCVMFVDSASAQCPGGGTVVSAGQLEVNDAAALEGECGLEVIMDGGTQKRFVLDETPDGEDTYRVSFMINPNDWATPGTGNQKQLAVVDAEAVDGDANTRAGIRVQFIRKTGLFLVKAKGQADKPGEGLGAQRKTPNVTLQSDSDPAATHLVEVEWVAATADGVRDGILRIRANGGPWAEQTMETFGFTIERVRFGGINGIDATMQNSFYLDDFQSFRTQAP